MPASNQIAVDLLQRCCSREREHHLTRSPRQKLATTPLIGILVPNAQIPTRIPLGYARAMMRPENSGDLLDWYNNRLRTAELCSYATQAIHYTRHGFC